MAGLHTYSSDLLATRHCHQFPPRTRPRPPAPPRRSPSCRQFLAAEPVECAARAPVRVRPRARLCSSCSPARSTRRSPPRQRERRVDNAYRQGLARFGDGWIFSGTNGLWRTDDDLRVEAANAVADPRRPARPRLQPHRRRRCGRRLPLRAARAARLRAQRAGRPPASTRRRSTSSTRSPWRSTRTPSSPSTPAPAPPTRWTASAATGAALRPRRTALAPDAAVAPRPPARERAGRRPR